MVSVVQIFHLFSVESFGTSLNLYDDYASLEHAGEHLKRSLLMAVKEEHRGNLETIRESNGYSTSSSTSPSPGPSAVSHMFSCLISHVFLFNFRVIYIFSRVAALIKIVFVPFQKGFYYKGKEFTPEWSKFSLLE